MRRLRAWLFRLGGLFNKELRDRELSAEMESHLQMHMEDNLRSGMSPAQARREAIMKLGGIEQTKENCRERRGLPILETTFQDCRYALRLLRGRGLAFRPRRSLGPYTSHVQHAGRRESQRSAHLSLGSRAALFHHAPRVLDSRAPRHAPRPHGRATL
jgi:hypothetical protein